MFFENSLKIAWTQKNFLGNFVDVKMAGIRYEGENVYEIMPSQSIAGKVKIVLPTAEGVLRLTVSDTVEVAEKPCNVILKYK